jgi:hypothetical protein
MKSKRLNGKRKQWAKRLGLYPKRCDEQKVTPVIDDSFMTELLRLGRLQKHLFVEGKRVGDKEYSTVLVAITELSTTLRKKLMSND